MHLRTLVGAAVLMFTAPALGQFSAPGSTLVREKIVGSIIEGTTTITPASGDQIAAFAKKQVVGLFAYDSDDPSFSIVVYGDNPATEEVDGAKQNENITFKFFDDSTNTEIDLQVVNSAGETVNLQYKGQELPPIELPGLDLTPTRVFDLRAGSSGGEGGGGGGGGGGGSGVDYDVDGDGKVTIEDAAMVLRIVVGASAAGSAAGDPDVDGDDRVTTKDAIEILRNR